MQTETTPGSVAETLGRLRALLHQELSRVEAMAREPTAEVRGPLLQALLAIRPQLDEHFRFEEENGYMREVLVREPNWERAAAHLREEHVQLLRSLDTLLDVARRDGAAPDGLGERVLAWAREVRRHESEENRLYQDAFNIELSAED
jgi:hypothetical protein